MNTTKITISVAISAPVAKVWECYTHPEHITQWNFAADSWHCPSASNNLVVGGKYVARMEAKDGSFGFDFEAIYDEIIPGKSLVYTMLDGRQASITFGTNGATTEVTIAFDAENQNDIEMQRSGWQAILNNFKSYVLGLG
jgi:uncharacterized protein YndB with AHSA1/START domain